MRQAVSLWRAMQTQAWRDDHPAGGADARPRYCFPALRHLAARLKEHDARWGEFFAAAGAPVLQITYEELVADFGAAVRRTLEHIGADALADRPPEPPAMRRQADELSEAWVTAYARDLPDLEPSPAAS